MQITPDVPRLRARTRGAAITGVGRAGKRVVIALDTGDRLVFEPRMTGLVLLRDPPSAAHVRLRIALEGAPCPELIIWDRRGLGTVRLLDPAGYALACGPPRLGPDALDVTLDAFQAQLASSRRPIKVALLDQAAIAGVGNIYAVEALHRARIHPARPCSALGAAEWRALHAELRRVLEEAIAAKGSTLSDRTYRTAESVEGGFQARHLVYARAGQPCACGGEVERIVQAQRATFFCPRCQR
jgi:formamidopyrimidine-DNA glycosylase